MTSRLAQNCSKMIESQMDVSTQTEPVVVLSLAQAAVLGLISQNEIFGATIAPNGFYSGEPREGPPPRPRARSTSTPTSSSGPTGTTWPSPPTQRTPRPTPARGGGPGLGGGPRGRGAARKRRNVPAECPSRRRRSRGSAWSPTHLLPASTRTRAAASRRSRPAGRKYGGGTGI